MAALTKSDIHFNFIGNDKSAKAVNSFKRNINSTNQALASLRNTIVTAFGVREIVNAANVMIGVENRMNALTGSAAETAKAMDHMRRIAIESRSDFDAVAMLFTRLSLATEHLGATQNDVAKATQMVANTFIIAGSHAQEANNSARQLAQGLASGALRGDELRSVMENNTILTKMLADGLNMTVGELREFGHAGKLTAETVMPILIAGIDETNNLIKDMPMTLGQAGVALRNNFQFIIGDVQKATGGFSGLASVINKFAENLDVILIPAVVGLAVAINTSLIPALTKLAALLLANPFGVMIVGMTAVATAAYIFRNEIVEVFQDIFKKKLPNLVDGFMISFKQFQKIFSFKEKDKQLDAEIAAIGQRIEKRTNQVFEKIKVPSIMDLLLGRDPNEKNGDGETGFKELTALEQFLMDAERGYKDFFTNIKTMQEEMQGVFKKSYDGVTQLTMDFLEKGKASFKDYATSIVRELIRIAVQKLVIDKMFASIGGMFKPKIDTSSLSLPTSIPSGDGGGFTGFGARAGGVDGKGGFPAILHPNETVIDHTKGQSMGATVNFNISTVDAAGFDQLLASRKGLITSIINNAMNNQGKMGVV
jgi:tape measure domain-containing protein